ncbi:MAG: hypothetical protein ACUZ8I_05555 [Candidatus Scalindua sp.]
MLSYFDGKVEEISPCCLLRFDVFLYDFSGGAVESNYKFCYHLSILGTPVNEPFSDRWNGYDAELENFRALHGSSKRKGKIQSPYNMLLK